MLTLGDLLGLILTGLMIVISLTTIFRRNGSGSTASDAQEMSKAWRILTQEQRREIEIRDVYIDLLTAQLHRARIEPVARAEAESIHDTIRDLCQKFSVDELDTLMLSIDIRPDQIAGDTIEKRARELVLAADRRGRLAALVRAMREERP